MQQETRRRDAIVIGGGHNGMVCAAYLAKKGLDVLVLEQRHVLGGATVTERIAGCDVSRLSYVYSIFSPKIVQDLELKQHGLELIERNPVGFTPLLDGRYLMVHQDTFANMKEIAKFSTKDAEAYPDYEMMLDRISRFIEKPLFEKPPDPDNWKDLFKLLGIAKLARDMKEDRYTLIELLSASAHAFVTKYFESEPLIATLCTDGIIGSSFGPMAPGTAYVLLHHVMGEVNGHRGRWAYIRGGTGGLIRALQKAGEKYNVEYETNADVKQILVQNGKAIGVELKDGREFLAKAVVSSADPKVTFLDLLEENDLPENFRTEIENIDYTSATSKVNLILSGVPKFNCLNGIPTPPGTIHICENSEYMERAADDSKYGEISENLILEACLPTLVDESLVPSGSGKQVMSILVQYTPAKLRESTWDARKDELRDKVVKKLAEYCNIEDLILETDVITPLDMERDWRLTGGNLFHGNMLLHKLYFMRPVPGYADHRTPVKNLYKCGSMISPGGGITGGPGMIAAELIKV